MSNPKRTRAEIRDAIKMTKIMTNKRNIQTPLEEIQEKLKTLERHPNASVEMYVWLRENIQRLKEHNDK